MTVSHANTGEAIEMMSSAGADCHTDHCVLCRIFYSIIGEQKASLGCICQLTVQRSYAHESDE